MKARETLARLWGLIAGPSPNGIGFAGKRTIPVHVLPRSGVISRRHFADREILKPRTKCLSSNEKWNSRVVYRSPQSTHFQQHPGAMLDAGCWMLDVGC